MVGVSAAGTGGVPHRQCRLRRALPAAAGRISNAAPGSLLHSFFFSVETFATIGYGVLAPATVYANTLMTAEAICGLLFVALTTGMLFARVSRPTARVLFSRVAVVSPFNGRPTLMVRMGNERTSQILQAEVTMTLVRNEVTREGDSIRRFSICLCRAPHSIIRAELSGHAPDRYGEPAL